MENYWIKNSLEKRKKEGYAYTRINHNRFGPNDREFIHGRRKFKVGDKVVCKNAENSGSRILGEPIYNLLEEGKIYTVSQLSTYHGITSVYVDDIGWRYMEERFDFAE